MRIAPACLVLQFFLAAAQCRTEILDRIAVSVGNGVITESEIIEELRVAAFLNRDKPDLGPASRRKAADRLVERTLISREMAFSRYPDPLPDEVDHALRLLIEQRFNGDAQAFRRALAEARLTESEVKTSLEEQLRMMQFIEVRFRPAVQISARDIQQYYERTLLPAWRKQHATRPPTSLGESSAEIEKAITQMQVDRALDRWLGDARRQMRIRFRDEVFR